MTLSELNNYTKRCEQIALIQQQLKNGNYSPIAVISLFKRKGKVGDGCLWDEEISKLPELLRGLKRQQRACERFIQNIDDCQTRKMFALHFIVGKTFLQTAYECGLGGNADCVKKRVYRYLLKNL